MTFGQLTILACFVFIIGIFTTVTGIKAHINTRNLIVGKKTKVVHATSISILCLIIFFVALFLEDRMVNDLEISFPHSYLVVNYAVTFAVAVAALASIINHWREKGPIRDKRMLFLDMGYIILINYLILSPAVMMIYYKLSTYA